MEDPFWKEKDVEGVMEDPFGPENGVSGVMEDPPKARSVGRRGLASLGGAATTAEQHGQGADEQARHRPSRS